MVANQPVHKSTSFPAPYPQYDPIVDRKQLVWPHNARVAVWVHVAVEHFVFGSSGTSIYPHIGAEPEIANYAWRDYGNRVGIWRLFEIFEDLEVPITVSMNAEVIDHYPRIVDHVLAKNWCILPHGLNQNNAGHSHLEPEEERRLITETANKFKAYTGRVPHGWMTPNFDISASTYDLVLGAGMRYTTDWVNDDQPYWYESQAGRLLQIPNSHECNDYFLSFASRMPGPEFAGAVEDTFDQLWADGAKTGRVMPIGLHSFISGQPMRAQYVRQFLQHIKKREQVWLTTSDAIYDFTAHPETWQEDHDW